MPSESILCITYFDTVIGPNIFYCNHPLNKVEHPDLGRILEFSETEGNFIFTYRKYQTINHIFYIESHFARGGKEILMITYMIRAAYFKDEISDVYNFLLSKAPDLEEFASELKKLKDLPSILHSHKEINRKGDILYNASEKFKKKFLTLFNNYNDRITPKLHITAPLTVKDNLKKIYIFGPPNSGRNTLLKNLEALQFLQYKNNKMKRDLVNKIYDFIIDNIEILTYECIESQEQVVRAKLYQECIDNSQGFILMYNASTKDSKQDAFDIFQLVLNRCLDERQIMPILVIGNKFDDKEVLAPDFIYEKYNKNELEECGMPIKLSCFNVLSDDDQIINAIQWLTKHLL
ncbi:MAG: GTPase domain-containing protein [Candidatus Thorarchaeota archaeon]